MPSRTINTSVAQLSQRRCVLKVGRQNIHGRHGWKRFSSERVFVLGVLIREFGFDLKEMWGAMSDTNYSVVEMIVVNATLLAVSLVIDEAPLYAIKAIIRTPLISSGASIARAVANHDLTRVKQRTKRD